ncbi:hypothetical protein LPJ56_001177 [Coemansia sp. RSA 2599]|nr:hypothetical protein LPJ75_000748 [Coemansia sp. RSA 2598]KAJ1828324.1 hypothetical protein LPJ56_001177 [Coemansia sp. RSA 2599]
MVPPFISLRLVPLLALLFSLLCFYRWYGSFAPAAVVASQPDKTPHRITWRRPFAYDIAVYASPFYSFYDDQSHFFSKSEQLIHVKDVGLDGRFRRLSKPVSVAALDGSSASQQVLLEKKYLHLFMQRSGQMTPHPAMGDRFLVHAMAPLVLGNASDDSIAVVTRVAWEFMLDDHVFDEWSVPVDVSRLMNMKYFSPSERRAYNPLAWQNPLVAQHPRSSLSSLALSKASGGVFSVDISLDQVSLEWMRMTNAVAVASATDDRDDLLLAFFKLALARLADCSRSTAVLLGVLLVARLAAEVWARGCVASYSLDGNGLPSAAWAFDFVAAAEGVAVLPKTGVSSVLDAGLLCFRLLPVYQSRMRFRHLLSLLRQQASRQWAMGYSQYARATAAALLAILAAYALLNDASRCYLSLDAMQALLGAASVVLQSPDGWLVRGLLLFAWSFDAVLLMRVVDMGEIFASTAAGSGSQTASLADGSLASQLCLYWPLFLPVALCVSLALNLVPDSAAKQERHVKSS